MSIATIALVLILFGIWHEEKLIALEDKMYEYICDRIGYYIAKVIIAYRRLTK
jgi:hypothetical protein